MTMSPPSSCPPQGPRVGEGSAPGFHRPDRIEVFLLPIPEPGGTLTLGSAMLMAVTAAPHGPVQGRDSHRGINH